MKRIAIILAVTTLLAPMKQEPDWQRVTSNDGTYTIRYRTTPATIELGVDFDIEAEVLDTDGELDLRIDGDMPEHGHGLLHPPRTERTGDATFRARELRCFMPGHWELYFDVTRGAVTERAQVAVEID